MEKLVLVTRPLEQAQDFAAELKINGFVPVIQPLIDIQYYPTDLSAFAKPDAIIVTSRQAMQAVIVPQEWIGVPVFCVGDKTSETARQAGFQTVIIGHGGIDGLLPLIHAQLSEGARILYLCGESVTRDLQEGLGEAYQVETRVAYRADAVQEWNTETLHNFSRLYCITLFSKRTGEILADFIRRNNLLSVPSTINLLCLSDAVLESVIDLPWQSVTVAKEPTQKSLLEALRYI